MKRPLVLASTVGAAVGAAALLNRLRVPVGMSRQWLGPEGARRSYLLTIPPGYEGTHAAPLVLSLHGFGSWPSGQVRVSGWNPLAAEKGIVVAYPSATGFPKRWHTWQPTQQGDVDDLGFISDVMDDVMALVRIDPARIYLSGLSNGGGMVNAMARLRPARIAAIGTVAGAYVEPVGQAIAPRPMPVIAFHGTADPVVPYQGGEIRRGAGGWVFPSIRDWADAWARRNGCTGDPQVLAISPRVQALRYSDCTADAEVILYSIEGGGHVWPGGGPLPAFITGEGVQEIDATRIMWEFFERHPLDALSLGD